MAILDTIKNLMTNASKPMYPGETGPIVKPQQGVVNKQMAAIGKVNQPVANNTNNILGSALKLGASFMNPIPGSTISAANNLYKNITGTNPLSTAAKFAGITPVTPSAVPTATIKSPAAIAPKTPNPITQAPTPQVPQTSFTQGGAQLVTGPDGISHLANPSTPTPASSDTPDSTGGKAPYNPYDVTQFFPDNFKDLQNAYYQTQLPTEQELALQKQMNDLAGQQAALNASYQAGAANVQNQPIAMNFITGQQAALQRQLGVKQAGLEAQQTPLANQLALLQAQRTAAGNVAQKRLENAMQLGQMAFQRSQPQAVAAGTNLVRLNPQTGQYEQVASGGITPTTEHSNYLQAVNQGFTGTQQQYQNYQKYADAMSAQGLTPVDPNSYIQGSSSGLMGGQNQDNSVFSSITQTANNGQKFLDMSKLPPGIGQSQGTQWAQQNGVKIVSEKDASTLRSIDAVKQQLDHQFTSIKDYLPGGPGARLLGGPLNTLAAYFQTNPQLGSYDSFRVGAENQIRALGASGVNEQTINTLLSSLPNISDTLPVAQSKIDHFNSEYDKIQGSILGAGTSSSNKVSGVFSW